MWVGVLFNGCVVCSEMGEILCFGLQGRRKKGRRGEMDGGGDRVVRRRKSLKERLSLKGINCCGASWGLVPATISVRDDGEDDDEDVPRTESPPGNGSSEQLCEAAADTPTSSGMNLAAALAAERQYRAVQDSDGGGQSQIPAESEASTPLRVSLMRLLEESDGRDGEATAAATEKEKESLTGSEAAVCCVCMGRKKGAAFIPCGHTFCRVCSRELWLNRGSCPLCNRSILEILDIY